MDPEMLQQAKKKKRLLLKIHISHHREKIPVSYYQCEAVSTVLSVGGGFVPADCSLVWSEVFL